MTRKSELRLPSWKSVAIMTVTAIVVLAADSILPGNDLGYSPKNAGIGYTQGVNVRNFGAKGDGISDDTAAIQSLLNTNPGEVFFPDGIYLINIGEMTAPITDGTDPSSCGIVISHPVKIRMSAKATLKAKDRTGTDTANYLISVQSENVVFEESNIDGNRYLANHSYGIQINKSNCRINNMVAKNFDSSPIVINGTTQNKVNGISISFVNVENVGNTIFAVHSNNNEIHHIIGHNVSEGIDLDKLVTDTKISDIKFSIIRGTGADAAVEINAGKRINVSNVEVDNFLSAVLINGKTINGLDERSEDINVENVVARHIKGHGIVIGNVFKAGDDLLRGTFTNITIEEASQNGIQVRGKHLIFNNIAISGSGYGGIAASSGGEDISYNNVTVKDCDRYALDMKNIVGFSIKRLSAVDNNKQPAGNGGPFPAIRLNGGCDGTIVEFDASGSHDFGITTIGANNIRIGNISSTGQNNETYKWSSGTVLLWMERGKRQ